MPNRKLIRFILGLLIGLGLLFAVARIVNLAQALEATVSYPWPRLAPVVILSLGYYLLKAARWQYLLSVIDIRLPHRRSILIYLAGQWFAFSPAGEFVRAYLMVPYGLSFSRGSAAVSVQVILDLLSLAVVASAAVFWFRETAILVLPFTALLAIAMLATVQGKRLAGARWFPSSLFSRVSAASPWSAFYDVSLQLLKLRPLLTGLALSILAVLLGAVILLLISTGYQIDIGLGQSTYIYTLSQLVGALSMLPHGLGAVEGSSVALFGYASVDPARAASAIILFRICTIGWSILLGGLALLSLRTPLAGPKVEIGDLASKSIEKGPWSLDNKKRTGEV